MKIPVLITVLFFGSQCFALDACPDNPRKRFHKCFGVKQDKTGKSKYVGSFMNNEFHGNGSRKWPDGRQYAGEFKEGIQHGQGTEIWPNGNKYIGQYKNGKRDGHGIYLWKDGRKFVGEFKNNKMHGLGTMSSPNGKNMLESSKMISFMERVRTRGLTE